MKEIGGDAGSFVKIATGYKTPNQQKKHESTSTIHEKNRFADFAAK